MTELPMPLTPPECDLRGMQYMPLDVIRLFDSDLYALSTGDEFKAAVTLWGKSFFQVPAASLPTDDRVLRHLSGAGPAWPALREMALRGWVECSDGRLYHPVVAEKAIKAWEHRLGSAAKTVNARAARAAKRAAEKSPTDEAKNPQNTTIPMSQTKHSSVTEVVTEANFSEVKLSKVEVREESCLESIPHSIFHSTATENPAPNDAQNTAPPQAAPPTAKRGSRLSEDWQPTDELRAYATALDLDADLVVENFRNYWSAVPGAKGLKLNWSATFKNSCLASKDRGQYLAKTAAVNGHSAPAPAVRLPEVWDDDEVWAPFCDGTSMWKDPAGTTSRNGMRPSVNGWALPEVAKVVSEAAKLPHTYNNWAPLIGWLNDGFLLHEDIRDVIRAIAARPGYQPPRSLAYFDKAVRTNTTENDHQREPKAKSSQNSTQH